MIKYASLSSLVRFITPRSELRKIISVFHIGRHLGICNLKCQSDILKDSPVCLVTKTVFTLIHF